MLLESEKEAGPLMTALSSAYVNTTWKEYLIPTVRDRRKNNIAAVLTLEVR